MNTGMRAWTTI